MKVQSIIHICRWKNSSSSLFLDESPNYVHAKKISGNRS